MNQVSEKNSKATNWVLGICAILLLSGFAGIFSNGDQQSLSTKAEKILEIRN
ncbi:hypothetical protein [Bacillus massiliigorillae]|uniref:hypothetical protein n=1 Tax=Bacillus massiliigorillae TaxID=1243664 RepID=UPI00039C3414|nr:hypothetical protein [Bacillus massiliigorillae]